MTQLSPELWNNPIAIRRKSRVKSFFFIKFLPINILLKKHKKISTCWNCQFFQGSRWLRCSVQLLSRVRLFVTSWTAARQASLSITNSWSSLRLMSTESVMPSNHLILCRPLLLLPSIFTVLNIFVYSLKFVSKISWPRVLKPHLATFTTLLFFKKTILDQSNRVKNIAPTAPSDISLCSLIYLAASGLFVAGGIFCCGARAL